MLQGLRSLFESKPAEPEPDNGKVTLGDVLRRNWFELWYQPKIDLRAKRLVGAEGLVRARRPDGSLLSPGAFLPGASEEDMLALTERVILTALRDFEDCAAQGAVAEALGQCAGVGLRQAADRADAARRAAGAHRIGPASSSKSPKTRP